MIGLAVLMGNALVLAGFVIFFELRLSASLAPATATGAALRRNNSGLCARGYCQRPAAIAVRISPETDAQLSQPVSPVPDPSLASTTTLAFVGDLMFDRNVAARSRAAHALSYPFANIGNLKRAFSANAVIANLEGPVGATRRPPEKTIDFLFDPLIIPVLEEEGIDAVSQANNHTLDQGRLGSDESRYRLGQAGIVVFGDEVHDDATSSLALLHVGHRTIALLGFNVTNNPLDQGDAAQAIASAKLAASTTIVFMHWGQEYHDVPTSQQTELAHWFIDQGVHAVIGGHPHWMQSIEVYRDHPIVYSLGNFVFDQDFSNETKSGLAVTLGFSPEATVLQLFPVGIDQSRPKILKDAARHARLSHLAAISAPALTQQILSGQLRLLPWR